SAPFDLVEFRIEHISLDENPQYNALSYTWGDPKRNWPIILNGKLSFVTHNLGDALRYLQVHEVLSPIWIDAICINQQNPKEKAEQVQQLRLIFQGAKNVIAWLGP